MRLSILDEAGWWLEGKRVVKDWDIIIHMDSLIMIELLKLSLNFSLVVLG